MFVRSGARPDIFTQYGFVFIRWCTRQFYMFAISSNLDGTQYNVVILAGAVQYSCWQVDAHLAASSGNANQIKCPQDNPFNLICIIALFKISGQFRQGTYVIKASP